DVHPRELVRNLSLSRRQMVEIAKALGRRPKMLILDEATSALTAADVDKVYETLRSLRSQGLSILYISHRMHEIAELADDCSVFRNGRHIQSFAKGSKTDDQVVELMIGREYRHVFPSKPPRNAPIDRPRLQLDRLSWGDRLQDISLSVDKGEIVGLGGLDGQGQRELLLALFGVLRGVSGNVRIDGQPVRIGSPRHAKSADVGMGLIPEDRKTEGLMLPMSVRDNISMAAISKLSKRLVVDRAAENSHIAAMVQKLQIKIGSGHDPVATLSGGNQQKVVIGKWLMTNANIVLLNDPTRGIDVGTKQELYQLLRDLADAGTAILFYSTDYDELIGCCDRVAILYDGRVLRELQGAEITERNIIATSLNLPLEGQKAGAGAAA
ncbi:MAG: sugar ABC transporter ATP-binding protein, partial [Dongiaceae bacterium]